MNDSSQQVRKKSQNNYQVSIVYINNNRSFFLIIRFTFGWMWYKQTLIHAFFVQKQKAKEIYTHSSCSQMKAHNTISTIINAEERSVKTLISTVRYIRYIIHYQPEFSIAWWYCSYCHSYKIIWRKYCNIAIGNLLLRGYSRLIDWLIDWCFTPMAVFQTCTCNGNGGNARNHEQVCNCAQLLHYSIKLWTVSNTDILLLS